MNLNDDILSSNTEHYFYWLIFIFAKYNAMTPDNCLISALESLEIPSKSWGWHNFYLESYPGHKS